MMDTGILMHLLRDPLSPPPLMVRPSRDQPRPPWRNKTGAYHQ